MMKNFSIQRILRLTLIAGTAALLASCAPEYETVFSESPDERVQKALDAYNATLKEAAHGWKAQLYTSAGAGYFYYLDFNDEGIVTMVSDFNAESASTPMAASWTIKALQQPTLSFDTYSYIHLPADPDGDVNGGNNGEGLLSDFEFRFVRTTADSVILKGLKHNTEMILTRATQAESAEILDDARISVLLQHTLDYVAANRGLRFLLPDDTEVPLAIDVARKLLAVQYLSAGGESIETFITPFTFSLTGIHLKDPLALAGYVIRDLTWDDHAGVYRILLDQSVSLYNATEPLFFYPLNPLHTVFGKMYSGIVIPENPEVNALPGQSQAFVQAYNEAAQELLAGVYRATVHEMALEVDRVNHLVLFNVTISQTSTAGQTSRFLAQYAYTYTISDQGMLDLTPQGSNETGSAIAFELRRMLQRLDQDTFSLEYIAGGFNLIGGFYSRETPGFSFSGYLRE